MNQTEQPELVVNSKRIIAELSYLFYAQKLANFYYVHSEAEIMIKD